MGAYEVICRISEAAEWKRRFSHLNLNLRDIQTVAKTRRFTQWYLRNNKIVNVCAFFAPTAAFTLFNISPEFLHTLFSFSPSPEAVPAMAPPAHNGMPSKDFFSGHGVILLHMLVLGFVTLVITTFLKFTGRGDLAPLVVFVGGGVILYEVLGLFKALYQEIETFLQM